MSNQENPRAESSPAPRSAESGRTAPHHLHGRMLEALTQSLANEGEAAYSRWGLALFHSLSDEDAMAQRKALGIENKEPLDFYNQGCVLATQEDYASAIGQFEKVLSMKADFPEALFNLALSQELSGNKTAAKASWQTYLDKFAQEEEANDILQHMSTMNE